MENETKTTEVMATTKAGKLRELLIGSKNEIMAALPKHVSPDRMLRIALTEARKTPELLDCDPLSFLGSVIQASQLGLEPGNGLGQCYLIPFNNTKTGKKEVQFMMGYQGMIDLVSRCDGRPLLSPRAVYEEDKFEFEFGLNEKVLHRPVPHHKDSKLVAVYCTVIFNDGRKIFDVMTRVDIDAARGRSKARGFSPWQTDFEAMAKKTVIRRMFKFLPKSAELQRVDAMETMAEIGESQRHEDILRPDNEAILTKGERIEKRMNDPDSFDNFKK